MRTIDPTKKVRALASKKSREEKSYAYIDKMIYSDTDIRYKVSSKRSVRSIMVYKNGNEIAL